MLVHCQGITVWLADAVGYVDDFAFHNKPAVAVLAEFTEATLQHLLDQVLDPHAIIFPFKCRCIHMQRVGWVVRLVNCKAVAVTTSSALEHIGAFASRSA